MSSQRTGLILGFDIGGTKSAVLLSDETGTILDRTQIATPSRWEPTLQQLSALGTQLLARERAEALCGVGVSCGSPVDYERGQMLRTPTMPDWGEAPVREYFESAFGVETRIENDANASALAEHRLGAGMGCHHMAFLTMGTGVGAGLILNGQLYRGKRDLAGEIGHVSLDEEGPRCACGKRGCLELYASGPGIARYAAENTGDHPDAPYLLRNGDITCEKVIRAAREGDKLSIAALDCAASAMGRALAALLHTLDLERIILGTIAVHAGDMLLEPIRKYVEANTWPNIHRGVTICPAGLGDAVQDHAAISLWL